jgi:hypothetical protein
LQGAALAARSSGPEQRGWDSTRITEASRYKDMPAPTEDDMIKVHYLKHHPLYEFRDFDEFHVDNYRHWLHQRADYWNTETYPAQISPWEMGSKWSHAFFLIFPFLSFYWLGNQYKEHLKQKNQKNTIVGVFSQDSL